MRALNCTLSLVCLALLSTGHAGTMGEPVYPGSVYVGGFGGGAGVSTGDMRQEGTAFFVEAAGGPLAVNAYGSSDSTSAWIAGGHIGVALPMRSLNFFGNDFSFSPAGELEAYYIGGAHITGEEINNDTVRLDEHDFLVSYQQRTGVFLVNAVLNANTTRWGRFHPYVGIGLGTALLTLKDATAVQLSPPEPGLNHFNSNTEDTALAFAAQPKVGVSVDISPRARAFFEYRFLYISESNFTFGSTVYPGHAATSNWDVMFDSQHYNMGTAGIQFDL